MNQHKVSESVTLEKKLQKTLTIDACTQCPHYMFDYQEGHQRYYGKSVCWFGREYEAQATPRLLDNENCIPKDCPLP